MTDHKVESLDEIRNQGFDAIVVTMGTSAGKPIPVKGHEIGHSEPAVNFLYNVWSGAGDENVKEGTKVIVLGGGNVAFDVARTAAKMGAKVSQFCLEARDKMLADEEEVTQAMEEGVSVHTSTTGDRRRCQQINRIALCRDFRLQIRPQRS